MQSIFDLIQRKLSAAALYGYCPAEPINERLGHCWKKQELPQNRLVRSTPVFIAICPLEDPRVSIAVYIEMQAGEGELPQVPHHDRVRKIIFKEK